MSHLLRLLLVPGALLLASCDLLGDRTETVPFQNVKYLGPLRVGEPQTAVFRDETAWTAFWQEHVLDANEDGEQPAPPPFDFDASTLIGVFWGEQYSGCSASAKAIERVTAERGRIIVHVGELPNLGPCLMVVAPVQVIQVERTEAPVDFKGHVPH